MTDRSSDLSDLPFGAMDPPGAESRPRAEKAAKRPRKAPASDEAPAAAPAGERSERPERGEGEARDDAGGDNRKDWRKRRRRRGGRGKGGGEQQGERAQPKEAGPPKEGAPPREGGEAQGGGRRKNRGGGGGESPWKKAKAKGQAQSQGGDQGPRGGEPLGTTEGLLVLDSQKHGLLRSTERGWLASPEDVHVPPRFVQKYQLREGSVIKGPYVRSKGRHKFDLTAIESVDGRDPDELKKVKPFKSLTSIAPDFHYNVGDLSGDLSLRIVDLLAPVGRGQRGLLVAPPRSGKTMILQAFAKAIEAHFPDVHLMVLLVDERPEEATEWRRTLGEGKVFVSTNDETAKRHVQLCEAVFKRCQRLVELGEEVLLLVDSLTRMGRAYNNVKGTSGKTMSGGIDARALEIPKQFFGLARNTETAGSLTILATALIETGSVMDKVIFEEFKGTGNMELVLSRRLADRRIFPAIDVERSGTRKEERLFSTHKLRQLHTLRRVLTRLHFAEAMELLITKLDEAPTNADFLKRFEVDPEA